MSRRLSPGDGYGEKGLESTDPREVESSAHGDGIDEVVSVIRWQNQGGGGSGLVGVWG